MKIEAARWAVEQVRGAVWPVIRRRPPMAQLTVSREVEEVCSQGEAAPAARPALIYRFACSDLTTRCWTRCLPRTAQATASKGEHHRNGQTDE